MNTDLKTVTCIVLLSVIDVHISEGFKVRLYPNALKTSTVHKNDQIPSFFSRCVVKWHPQLAA